MTLLSQLMRPRREAKAALGPGAVQLEYLPKLWTQTGGNAAARGQQLGISNLWIRACERAISGVFAGLPWTLLDTDGEPVTDDSRPEYVAVRDLLDKPYHPQVGEPVSASPRTGRGLRHVTSRHMGVSGGAFWYLSETEMMAGTPKELLYVNPARVEPATNAEGQLVGWVMDRGGRNPVGFTTAEMLYFPLEEPDSGHTATGLVESALGSADVVRLADRQASGILSSGGRLTGIVSPKEGTLSDTDFEQITRDLRTITDMPDAAKRNLVLKGAVSFEQTSVSPTDLDLVALSQMGRDALLALWGVPLSQLGGATAAGLNSGERPKYDEATLYQKAVQPRLDIYREVVQGQLLDRFAKLGIELRLEIDEPTYDDDAPAWEMVQRSLQVPMRNKERREMVKLPPLGDDTVDEAVTWYVPGMNLVTTDPAGNPIPALPQDAETAEPLSAEKAMAFAESDTKARMSKPIAMEARVSARLSKAIATFLDEQRKRIAASLQSKSGHIALHPADTDAYFPMDLEDARLLAVMEPELARLAAAVSLEVSRGKASLHSDALVKLAPGIAKRVTAINETTRQAIRDAVVLATRGDPPVSMYDLALAIREMVPPLAGDVNAWKPVWNGAERAFASELRAETIARTETRWVSNTSAINTYGQTGIEKVRAIDGDDDPECAARDGKVFTLAEAEDETGREHPNGTLVWQPITIGDVEYQGPGATTTAPTPTLPPVTAKPKPIPKPRAPKAPKPEAVKTWAERTFDEAREHIAALGYDGLVPVLKERYGVAVEKHDSWRVDKGDLRQPRSFSGPNFAWTREQMAEMASGYESVWERGLRPRVNTMLLTGENPTSERGGIVMADMNEAGRMRVNMGASTISDGWGIAEGDRRGLRSIIQHELGHAFENADYSARQGKWATMYASRGGADSAELKGYITQASGMLAQVDDILEDIAAKPDAYTPEFISQYQSKRERFKAHLDGLMAEYKEAQATGGDAKLSDYGETNDREDFAEAFYAHLERREWLEQAHPKRAKLLAEMTKPGQA